jgi:1-acyl-sn-glycerol-3-phosphate acyltransferase
MATFEEEFKRIEPIIKTLSNLSLLGKKVVIRGKENFIKKGPNIIIGNHVGTFKDIATLSKIVPRHIFFTANRMLFDRDDFTRLIRYHLKKHLKNFGLFVDLIISPIKSLFVKFVSTNISKIGAIPVDLDMGRTKAMERCQEYLRDGRAIITLQGRGRITKIGPNPYMSYFRKGVPIISYNLYKEGIIVPVTPIAIFGTQVPFMIPTKIKVNVGEPMYVHDYLAGEPIETVNRFRKALEKRVKILIYEIVKSQNLKK